MNAFDMNVFTSQNGVTCPNAHGVDYAESAVTPTRSHKRKGTGQAEGTIFGVI